MNADLEELRHHWGEAYVIMLRGLDGWQAKRRDDRGGWLEAGTAGQLYELIHADYAARPVRRQP